MSVNPCGKTGRKRMLHSFKNSIFLKIFMWFIIALAIIVLLGTIAAYITHNHITKTEIRSVLQEVVENNASTIADLYSDREDEKASSLEESIARTTRVRIVVFPAEIIISPPERGFGAPPDDFLESARRVLSSGESHLEFKRNVALYMVPVTPEKGERFVVTGLRRLPPPLFRREATRALFLNIFLVLLTGAAACYWLANHLTSPVKELRSATLRLSEGDLSRRVDPGVLKRKDELGELAQNFNAMAEKLEELVTAQKRLMGDISHELRSPLTRLNLSLELARKKSTPESKKYLDRIEKESLAMNEMIGEVLSLAKIETESGQIKIMDLDLSDLIRSISRDANFEAEAKGCSVVLDIPENLNVRSDPNLITRTLDNITRNAVRHTREGSRIEISLKKNNQQVSIAIRDHGKGVDEKQLEKIFLPFYRLDESRDRKQGGTGLGLAIAERATRLLGGTIKAYNALEGGLVVEISLPLEKRPENDPLRL